MSMQLAEEPGRAFHDLLEFPAGHLLLVARVVMKNACPDRVMLVRGIISKESRSDALDARAVRGRVVANHQLGLPLEDDQQLLFIVRVRRMGTMARAQHRNVAVHVVDDRGGTAEKLVRLPTATRLLGERKGHSSYLAGNHRSPRGTGR